MDIMSQASVRVAGLDSLVAVGITSNEKPKIDHGVMDGWQNILNILAKTADVPVALIMKIENKSLYVFLSSESGGNPYKRGDKKILGTGYFCETVIGESKMLEVPDALADPLWQGNPETESNMISYLGFPLQWEDGEIFGTICILDEKKRNHGETIKQIMNAFKNVVQRDLELIEKNSMIESMKRELKDSSLRDGLTGLYNHKAIHEFLFIEIQNAVRYDKNLTIAMVDVDRFKEVNDQYGHKTGDIMLKGIADLMKSRLRDADIIGRYGGDKFLVVFTDTTKEDAYRIIERLRKSAEESEELGLGVTLSAGIATLEDKYTADELVSRADAALYKAKSRGRNKVIDY
jgi:diguanylate cyclase (GGDEF)-like protein